MSVEARLREEFDRWERQQTVVTKALPYLLLAISAMITLLLWDVFENAPLALALSAAAAAWLLWIKFLPAKAQENSWLMALHYAGLLLLSAALVVLAAWYGIFAFVGYVHAFLFLRGAWRYVGVIITSMIMSVSYIGGVERIRAEEWWLWPAICLVSIGLSVIFFFAAETSDRQALKQKRALAELHEANVKLAAALEENAALHARLLVHARRSGVMDERQRMASEIHDTLAQSPYAAAGR